MLERKKGTTRQYRDGTGVRQATSGTTANAALPTLGETREVRVHATEAAWLRFGTGATVASVAATSIPLVAGVEVVEVPADATHFAVIQDSAGGFVTLTPVA